MGAGQVGAWVAAGRREGPSRLEKEGHGLQRRGGASGQLGQHCGASGSDGTTSSGKRRCYEGSNGMVPSGTCMSKEGIRRSWKGEEVGRWLGRKWAETERKKRKGKIRLCWVLVQIVFLRSRFQIIT